MNRTCYALGMVCSAATLDGLLLAAAARPTPKDGRARPLAESGLTAKLADLVRTRRRALEESSPTRRHESLRLAATRLMPDLGGETLPARARALLAADVPRPLGQRWIAEAPRPRRGFRARPGLRSTLSRIGRQARTDRAGQDADARGDGRRALLHARSIFAAEDACLSELSVEPEEAVAVQTLEGLGAETSSAPQVQLLRLLLRATAARPEGTDISLALGRMLRAVSEDSRRDASLERTGREIAEWVRATCPE